jgi:hypothetical protein
MTQTEALQMCLEYIETDAHERKYVRHAIKAALANEALERKAENARELGLDYEPLEAKDEAVAYLCENAVGHKYFRWKKPSSTYKPIALYTRKQP